MEEMSVPAHVWVPVVAEYDPNSNAGLEAGGRVAERVGEHQH